MDNLWMIYRCQELWLVVTWNMTGLFSNILGMSSSQLTFIFFRWFETTNQSDESSLVFLLWVFINMIHLRPSQWLCDFLISRCRAIHSYVAMDGMDMYGSPWNDPYPVPEPQLFLVFSSLCHVAEDAIVELAPVHRFIPVADQVVSGDQTIANVANCPN